VKAPKKKTETTADQKAVNVIRLFRHTKGEFAGRPFQLQDWQEQIIRGLFRTGPDGRRIVRESLIFLPRKNGKSEIAAAIGLYFLLFDGEPGAEVYLAASDKDQASIVFSAASAMVKADANLMARCKVIDSQRRIVVHSTNSFLAAVPADEAGAHGFNASCVIYDELHCAPNRDLYDTLRTSMGARRQPLLVSITTAGYDRKTICYERYDYACKVRDGVIKDPTFLPVIYEAPKDADWKAEATWRAANPGLNGPTAFRSIEEIARTAKEAAENPGLENAFRRLYLNQWTTQDTRWLSMAKWAACEGELRDLTDRPCFAALDLATTTDIAALTLLFPDDDGTADVVQRYWVPEEGARKRARRDRVPYEEWIAAGLITATPGEIIDYDRIRLDMSDLRERFNIRDVAMDPWNATQLATQLQGDGFEVCQFRQGFGSMASPTKELEKLVLGARLRTGGCPVLSWMASNVAVEQDAAGNIKPSKKKSTERIDGIVTLIMAVGRMGVAPVNTGSVYESRGLLVL